MAILVLCVPRHCLNCKRAVRTFLGGRVRLNNDVGDLQQRNNTELKLRLNHLSCSSLETAGVLQHYLSHAEETYASGAA